MIVCLKYASVVSLCQSSRDLLPVNSSSRMGTPLAHASHPSNTQPLDDDFYPFLEGENIISSDNDLFMSICPTSFADMSFGATLQALPSHQTEMQPSSSLLHKSFDDSLLHHPLSLPHSQNSALVTPESFYDFSKQFVSESPRYSVRSGGYQRSPSWMTSERSLPKPNSPSISPPSSVCGGSDEGGSGMKDAEEILKAPVKSLTEEEKKLRRRAQVAKSARKHRNRQKEELVRLREQVQMLQEQMALMSHHQGSSSSVSIKREQEVITKHCKRKKVEEETSGGYFSNSNFDLATISKSSIQRRYHRLPLDTSQRSTLLTRIADKRMSIGEQYYIHGEFRAPKMYPLTDITLNSNGPDLEIKQVRGRLVSGFTHYEVGEACWNSFSNFVFDVPERFRRHVTCERLMELDANTRYGRTIVPLLRDQEGRMVHFHSYFVVRRHVRDDYVLITWETITEDDLYPPAPHESPETAVRNDEVGCTPPVGVMKHPRGQVNEAFLSVFCRNADIVENSAWNLLMKTHPDRMRKAEVIM
ncbi:hypothetical protein PsorP6_002037 [Peronosclerospora sorghi]|uniref:Uncharacterized protein n=1 Tax=Peronosclerospora sorghi TaxID=230839 RepID=A0ACC0WZA7_9STRA|nr:hypothetical protein PsorP6_002037 [Peronosclerospora sorghi]